MRCSELTPEYIHATIRLLKGGEGPPGIENSDSPLITKSKGEPVSSVRNGELPSKSNDTSYTLLYSVTSVFLGSFLAALEAKYPGFLGKRVSITRIF